MLRVGLTGGIGSGKSTVATRLAEHGAVVIDADRIARDVVEPGTDGLAEVVAEFGDEVRTADGRLNRPALARAVFGDDSARARLNAILHPRIAARTGELVAAAPTGAVVVHDVPLLVENRLAPGYHLVVVVDAPVDVRLHRLVADRGMSEVDARARIAAQATEEQRRAVADVWLDNGGARDDVLAATDALWADQLVRFESDVRLRRPADPGKPRVLAHDDGWPARAARAIARLRLAAGEQAMRVDHIGSTAVPGLAGVDVVDLMVTVSAAADVDAVAARIGDAGFPATTEEPEWSDRVHAGADPARYTRVHVCVVDSPGWWLALATPAWLAGDPAAAVEYAELKLTIAAGHPDAADYALAKRPWFAEAAEVARAWAETTGWRP
jgi:dephospho-CoA kinase